MKPSILALCAVVALATAGCNRTATDADGGDASGVDKRASKAGSSTKTTSDDAPGSAWDEKVQAYIKVGNTLQRFSSSTNETLAEWAAEAREKVAKGDFKEIASSTTFSDSALADLKAAMAMPGKTPELDRPARTLADALDAGLPAWRQLEEYNTAKRHEDDGGAKGKALLVQYNTTLAAVDASLAELETAVGEAARVAHDKALAKFKADGKLLEMHTWQATGDAEKVLGLFDDAEDFKDTAKIKKADGYIASMETSIDGMRAEHAKRKAKDDSLPMIDRYDGIASNLVELAGHYREARKEPSKFNDAVDDYNDAIGDLNMMNR